jgi:uncharacterized membrane protein
MTNIPVLNKDVPKGLLALVLVLAAVGAATGITLAGSISGTAATEVDQAITLNESNTVASGDALDSNLTTVSDDGTEFRTGVSVNQGDSYKMNISLDNEANTALNGQLILSADAPLQVSAEGDDNVNVQRLDSETFLLEHRGTDGTSGTVTITVAAPNDIEPGFYEIQGEVVPAQA